MIANLLYFDFFVAITMLFLSSIFLCFILLVNVKYMHASNEDDTNYEANLSENERKLLQLSADMKDVTSVNDMLDLLLQGVNPNVSSDDGESALHLACIWNSPQKVKLLLEYGANPNYRANKNPSSLNMTPLTWCVYGGHTEAVREFLLDKRTNINLAVYQEDRTLITALDIAYKIGDMGSEMVDLLRNAGGKLFEQLREEYENVENIPELY